jgi:hypothetical protein
MKQIFEPFWKWEDFLNGMYDYPTPSQHRKFVNASIGLLSDPGQFRKVAIKMVVSWPVSASVNITNLNANRRAWIGQASCCFAVGSPEICTREAWKLLSEQCRIDANKEADFVIREYEALHCDLHQDMEGPRLFAWTS